MSNFVRVNVRYENGVVTCDQERALLYQLCGPRGIEWMIESTPPGTVGVMIRWQGEPPFTTVGMTVDGKRIAATGCRFPSGYYKYSILFTGSGGKVIAELDPGVAIEPDPPVWPDD